MSSRLEEDSDQSTMALTRMPFY